MGDDGEVQGLRVLAEQVYDLTAVRRRWGKRLKVSCNGNASAEPLPSSSVTNATLPRRPFCTRCAVTMPAIR